jgi:RND family efflux transporter MFP subunit
MPVNGAPGQRDTAGGNGRQLKMRSKRAWWWVAGGGLLAAGAVAALVVSHIGKKDDKPPEPTLEFAPREVVQPARVTMAQRIEFSGPLVAPQTATVRAKAGGTLLTLTVAEGSRVAAGQVLATIDGSEVASRLAERAAMVESARASLTQAERTHANNQRLAEQNFISATALDQSRAALDAARAQANAARAQLDTVRAVSRDTRVLAPIAGIVAKRHAVAGEKVAAEQNLLTLVDLRTLELAGAVGTHEVSLLSPGLPVEVRVEGVAAPVMGTIARIAPAAEAGTRSIGVTIALANKDEKLRAGQYALASVELVDAQPRLTVPANALASSAGQDHVWLIENGILARRAVTVGRRDAREGRVEVLAGVAPDSQVLAARFDNLREGAKAAVASSPASAPVQR